MQFSALFYPRQKGLFKNPELKSPGSGGITPHRDRAELRQAAGGSRVGGLTTSRIAGKRQIFPSQPEQASDAELEALGEAIQAVEEPSSRNFQLPMGYVFLSQFIEHDITRNPDGGLHRWQDVKFRGLDLDCVYGEAGGSNLLRHFAHPDHLIIGRTTGTGDYNIRHSLPNDLPRIVSGAHAGRALIGDPRNDLHLGIAQTHLQFLKLHNRFVEIGMDFSQARKATVQHYQSMIINDFLPRIIDSNVYNAVIKQPGYVCFTPRCEHLPLEFSLAAYRFAGSMLDARYEWNEIFRTGGLAGPATLAQLYQLSGRTGKPGRQARLPTHWVIDWRYFYDLSADDGELEPNLARTIGGSLAADAASGGDAIDGPATRLLKLGKQYQLANGQTLVDLLNERGMMLRPLAHYQLDTGNDRLNRETPLWYYIMRESHLQQNGKRLGQLGSWLVADIFKKLLLESPYSVLNDTGFTPHRDVLNGRKTVTMPGIIEFTGDVRPLLETD